MFTTSHKENENVLMVSFKGRMDGLSVKEIEPKLIQELITISEGKSGLKVVFDMAETEYIASSFIRMCVAAAKDLPEGNFSITNTNPLIKKTFKIAGLETVLNVT